MTTEIIIPSKYCGPHQSGNGGYSAGILAEAVDFSIQVTLKKPPPLDKSLMLKVANENITLSDNAAIIAEAQPYNFEMEVPNPPDRTIVEAASKHYAGHQHSPFPNCFVCGVNRKEGDGLRIFAGPITDKQVAAIWKPYTSLSKNGATVDKRYIWSALDCPGAWASMDEERMIVLGRMAVKQFRKISIGEEYIVMGWEEAQQGRKVFTGTAIFNLQKELCAMATQIWIAINPSRIQ